jgi:hypothetical protein
MTSPLHTIFTVTFHRHLQLNSVRTTLQEVYDYLYGNTT